MTTAASNLTTNPPTADSVPPSTGISVSTNSSTTVTSTTNNNDNTATAVNTTTNTTNSNATNATSTTLPGSSALGSALGVNVSSMATVPTRPTIIIDVKMPLQGIYDPSTIAIKKTKPHPPKKENGSTNKSEGEADTTTNDSAGEKSNENKNGPDSNDNSDKGNYKNNEDDDHDDDHDDDDDDAFDSDIQEMDPSQNAVVDFMRLAEKKYGYEKVHPYAARSALELAGGDLNDMDEDEDDSMLIESVTASDKETVNPVTSNTTSSSNKRSAANNRAKIEGKYDLNDPFIDDSEMLWEEQAVSTKDGFFVYSGPLVNNEGTGTEGGTSGAENGGEQGSASSGNSNNPNGNDKDSEMKNDGETPHGTKRARSGADAAKTPKPKKANRKSDTKKTASEKTST